MQKYCFDTNVLIEPWNKYYSPKLCPAFWDMLSDLIAKGSIFCTQEVEKEIIKVDDGLKLWINGQSNFVHDISEDVQRKLRDVLKTFPRLVDTKKDRSMADPWVIAHAWSIGATVVTKEMPTYSTNKIKIPDVCKHFNIRCIDDFDFLKEINVEFSIRKYDIKKRN